MSPDLPRRTVAVALGANLGDPRATLTQARHALVAALVGLGTGPLRFSRLFETDPVGPPQRRYLNAACVFGAPPSLDAGTLLAVLQSIERQHGRIRCVRFGPRTLDLDLLVVGGTLREDPALTLPHPRMADRPFVLQPLLDVAADLHVVGRGTVRVLAWRAGRAGVWPVTSDSVW